MKQNLLAVAVSAILFACGQQDGDGTYNGRENDAGGGERNGVIRDEGRNDDAAIRRDTTDGSDTASQRRRNNDRKQQ